MSVLLLFSHGKFLPVLNFFQTAKLFSHWSIYFTAAYCHFFHTKYLTHQSSITFVVLLPCFWNETFKLNDAFCSLCKSTPPAVHSSVLHLIYADRLSPKLSLSLSCSCLSSSYLYTGQTCFQAVYHFCPCMRPPGMFFRADEAQHWLKEKLFLFQKA